MYQKPSQTTRANYSPSGGNTLEDWRPGLQVRIPVNSPVDYALNNFFAARTTKTQPSAKRSRVPRDFKRISVDNYRDALSDDLGFHSSTQSDFNSNNSLDRAVNVYSLSTQKYAPRIETNTIADRAHKVFDVFKINDSLNTFLKTMGTLSHWEEQDVYNLTSKNVFLSLRRDLATQLSRIRTVAGDYQVPLRLVDIIRNRLIYGTLDYDLKTNINFTKYIKDLFTHQESLENFTYLVKSKNRILNEKFAVSYAQQVMKELSPSAYQGEVSYLYDIYRSVAPDLGKRLPLSTASGTVSSISIGYNESLKIHGSGTGEKTLLLNNGNFFTVDDGRGNRSALSTKDEKAHAFRLYDRDKQRVLSLLGAEDTTKLEVESLYSNAVEYTNDLNADGNKPRSNFYFMKLNTSSIDKPKMLKRHVAETTVEYDLITDDNEIADWIKYNSNFAVFAVDNDDIFLDYLVSSTSMKATSLDFTFNSYGPITDDNIPIIVRNIPWSIILVPTDQIQHNPYKAKSHIKNFDSTGIMSRELNMAPHFDNRYSEAPIRSFLSASASDHLPENVYMEKETSGAALGINTNVGYLTSSLVSGVEGVRTKTSIRKIAEIVTELNKNYTKNGGFTWFDVVSRLNMNEFAELVWLENSKKFLQAMENGLIGNARLYNTYIRDAAAATGSRLVLKKEASEDLDDVFFPIKLHSVGTPPLARGRGYRVTPPTTSDGPTLEQVDPEDANTTFGDTRRITRAEDVSTNIVIAPEVFPGLLGDVP